MIHFSSGACNKYELCKCHKVIIRLETKADITNPVRLTWTMHLWKHFPFTFKNYNLRFCFRCKSMLKCIMPRWRTLLDWRRRSSPMWMRWRMRIVSKTSMWYRWPNLQQPLPSPKNSLHRRQTITIGTSRNLRSVFATSINNGDK